MADKVVLGPGLSISKNVLQRIKTKKVGSFVANLMGATLTREYMATHSYKGQKGKNGQTKPKLDTNYTASLIKYAKSVRYTELQRPVIDEDIVKAIKFKLNNEEQAFKKQQE
ncbi:uncharacterized protein LOC114543868 [Dendronephthya gigantea]|uniref:uncharacterized protein LOC114543868 n=1 Tax=Dendronephthya gigantea TaxID=151771 RepID=UPI0010699FCA|nr:uncharacterized protein LOC114543868 [Dendronephthya gigantea]